MRLIIFSYEHRALWIDTKAINILDVESTAKGKVSTWQNEVIHSKWSGIYKRAHKSALTKVK